MHLRHMGGAHLDDMAYSSSPTTLAMSTLSEINRCGRPDRYPDQQLAVTAPSDYRMKNELGPVVDALTRVMQLHPKHLEWDRRREPFDGFIAHASTPWSRLPSSGVPAIAGGRGTTAGHRNRNRCNLTGMIPLGHRGVARGGRPGGRRWRRHDRCRVGRRPVRENLPPASGTV